MFEKLTNILYDGHYDHPIRISFENAFITLTGEGGNRHIIVGDNDGCMDVWIDTHTCGKYFAFLGNSPSITRNPSGKLVNRVWNLINQTTEKNSHLDYWTKDKLDEFFERLYYSAREGFFF